MENSKNNKNDLREPSLIVSESENKTQSKSHFSLYFKELWNIALSLPSELSNFGQIPCAQRAIYSGMLAGGVVTAISIAITGRLKSLKYGFFSYVGTSIISWEYCNSKYRTRPPVIYKSYHDDDPKDRVTETDCKVVKINS